MARLRAVHLLDRLEKVQRDLNEIQNLRQNLPADRTYAGTIQESLQSELLRLQELQQLILSQVVRNPPESLTRGVRPPALTPAPVGASGGPSAFREPELVLPGRRPKADNPRTDAPPAEAPVDRADPPHQARPEERRPRRGETRAPAATASSPAEQGDDEFQFRFIQK